MREEYNSVLSTPTEADKIGRFRRYRYIGKTQIFLQNFSFKNFFYIFSDEFVQIVLLKNQRNLVTKRFGWKI